LEFIKLEDYEIIEQGDMVCLKNLPEQVVNGKIIKVEVKKVNGKKVEFETKHSLSDRQINILLKGGIINEFKEQLEEKE
jgi:aconitate hydratase